MKPILIAVLALWMVLWFGVFAHPVRAQQQITRTPDCILTGGTTVFTAVGTSQPFDNRSAGCVDWVFNYSSFGFTAATLQINSAPNNQSSPGTPVVFAGDVLNGLTQPVTAGSQGTISVSGYYPYISVSLVTKTGTGSLQGSLQGWRAGGSGSLAGMSVIVTGCSAATCYTYPVNTGVAVIASGSTSTLFSTTTLLQSFRCNNQNAAAVTISVTDGNNAYFVGPLFSMAGLSNTEFQANNSGSIMAAGVKASASAANSINCWASGKQ